MNILVTGGAGYIGSHTAKLLAASGLKPVVFDNLDRGHEWAVQWGPLVKADLSDRSAIEKALQKNKIDAVIHFAAHSCVGESVEKPELYFRNNVIHTMQLLEAMLHVGVKTIVFSSTAAVYGNPVKTPIEETHPQSPINPYGDTKLFIERALHWHRVAHGLKWVALRYFNAAGADPEGEIGEDHTPESHLIPLVIYAALGKRKQIDIFGTDYPTPDGTAVRDYIHVTDLADAHLKALNHLTKGGESMIFNLGTGSGYSVREVIQMVERVTGKPVPKKEAPRRAGDPPVLVASSEKAKKILKWEMKYSGLDKIVETAWRWHEKNSDKL